MHGKDLLNYYGTKRTPVVFLIDYSTTNAIIRPLSEVTPEELSYSIGAYSNTSLPTPAERAVTLEASPQSYEEYLAGFQVVQGELEKGNSYLTNLTCLTSIKTSLSLADIYRHTEARYRIKYGDSFVCFSPESFVTINNNIISSYPMKGTIRADVADAENKIINDEKEFAEHITIVDLIRNDLAIVARDVKVNRFRYIDRLETNRGAILQVSSEISGILDPSWQDNLGSLLYSLLPAGSISGAPKKKTMEIIASAETYNRGYYTGICGIFDGESLDTGVMIRFIENSEGRLFYKSGGGITIYSDPVCEYEEMIAKIYIPIIKE